MTITPFRDTKGQPGATVACDGCGAETKIKTQHERTRGGPGKVHLGNAIRKLTDMGWVASAAKQTCPTCVAAKRAKPEQEEPMTTTTATIPAPAEATREQKREIMLMLQEVYDTGKQRYKGEETDKTVAHALGIERWGWVSKIREELFGPAGNEAAEKLVEEVKSALSDADAALERARYRMGEMGAMIEEVTNHRARLAALLQRVKVAG